MRSAAQRKPVIFSPTIQPFLAGLTAKFSEGKDSLVEKICEVILQDLDRFCAFNKKYGEERVREMRIPNTTYTHHLDGPFAGSYVGFGFGENWLNLGFLENPIAEALRQKFVAMSTAHADNDEPCTVNTMLDSVSCDDWIWKTPRGTFILSHTYTWFVQRKIE